jgi:phage baseplate assembly protein W
MTIILQPSTTSEEIAQNVRIIAGTRQGTQPLNRSLGIQADIIDAPGPRGQALFVAAIIDTLPRQEPRVNVNRVEFSGDSSGGEYSPTIDYEVVA